MGYRRFFVALLACALIATACTSSDDTTDGTGAETDATTRPTSATTATTEAPTTSPPTTDDTVAPTDSTTSTTEAPTTTTEPEPTTTAAPPGTVIVAALTGVWINAYEGGSTKLVEWSSPLEFEEDAIDFAIDDLRGGIIVQPNRSPYFYEGADAIAFRIPQGGNTLQSMLVPADDQGLVVEDVVAAGDAVHVYYTRTEGSLPDDSQQTLRRFDVDTVSVEEIAQVGGWESGSNDVSVGGDLIVTNGAGEAYYWVNFYALDGSLAASPANPLPDGEFDCPFTCGWGAAINPDGTQIVYPTQEAGSVTFTIVDVVDGSVEMTFSIPNQGAWVVESLDFGDDFLVVNRIEEGSVWNTEALVVDLSTGGLEVWEVPHFGVARLVTTTPDLDGVVQYP